jgi:hypothetical protein
MPNEQQAPPTDDQRLLDFLVNRSIPCPACGYDLRNLTTPTCPECRQPLYLTVGVRTLRFGLFLLAATLPLAAGLVGVMLGIAILWHERTAPPETLAALAFLLLSGAGGLCMVAARKSFILQRQAIQLTCGLTIWLIHAAAFFALMIYT